MVVVISPVRLSDCGCAVVVDADYGGQGTSGMGWTSFSVGRMQSPFLLWWYAPTQPRQADVYLSRSSSYLPIWYLATSNPERLLPSSSCSRPSPHPLSHCCTATIP